MKAFGKRGIEMCKDLVGSLLDHHQNEIEKAYLKAEEDLAVGMKIKLSPAKNGGIEFKAEINFVTDRVKDSISGHVDEDQLKFEFEKPKGKVLMMPMNRIGSSQAHPFKMHC